MRIVRPASMSAASSRAPSRPSCPCSSRTSTNWSSTPRPRGCLASPCRPGCARSPTRCSSKAARHDASAGELARADRQVAEVAVGPDADEKSHRPMRLGAAFEIIHDQRRLRGATDIEPRLRAGDLDPQMRPFADLEVDVGFVLARSFTPQAVEIIAGIREILGRAVAPQLVAGAAVAGPDIESLARERPALLIDAEGHPDKAAGVRRRVRQR